MQQLTNLAVRRASSIHSKGDELEGSDMNPFHHHNKHNDLNRHRRWGDWSDMGLDLNIKIEIPEYHESLCNNDFMEWLETIEWVFQVPTKGQVSVKGIARPGVY